VGLLNCCLSEKLSYDADAYKGSKTPVNFDASTGFDNYTNIPFKRLPYTNVVYFIYYLKKIKQLP